jgi:hypothetical protein
MSVDHPTPSSLWHAQISTLRSNLSATSFREQVATTSLGACIPVRDMALTNYSRCQADVSSVNASLNGCYQLLAASGNTAFLSELSRLNTQVRY